MTVTLWVSLFFLGAALSLFWLVTRQIVLRSLRAAQTPGAAYQVVERRGWFSVPSTEGLAGHYFRVRVRDEAAFLALVQAGLSGRALPGARLWLWLHVLYLPVFLLLLTILIIWTPRTPHPSSNPPRVRPF